MRILTWHWNLRDSYSPRWSLKHWIIILGLLTLIIIGSIFVAVVDWGFLLFLKYILMCLVELSGLYIFFNIWEYSHEMLTNSRIIRVFRIIQEIEVDQDGKPVDIVNLKERLISAHFKPENILEVLWTLNKRKQLTFLEDNFVRTITSNRPES